MNKMTIVPTRAGIMYECYYCKVSVTPEQADTHECIECKYCGNALVNDKCPDTMCDAFEHPNYEIATTIYDRIELNESGGTGSVQRDLMEMTSQAEMEEYFGDLDPAEFL